MRISEIFKNKAGEPVISFEIFPPKKEEAFKNVGEMLGQLRDLEPDFISVTCGAGGGSNRNRTIELASKIKNEFGVESMAHMTCIASSPRSVEDELECIKNAGIENILALRGDIPKDEFDINSVYYHYAYELINKIKEQSDICIGAGAYPEGHIECESFEDSVKHMKIKEETGAEFFVSQLFFSNEHYYRLVETAEKYNIKAPISPGIMPMMSKSQISNMIFMCGASLPSAMIKLLHKYENNHDDLMKAGIEYAGKQISDLINSGVGKLHIYSMNKPEVAKQLIEYTR